MSRVHAGALALLASGLVAGAALAEKTHEPREPERTVAIGGETPRYNDPSWDVAVTAPTPDETLARVWNLTPAEIRRYRELSLKNSRFAVANVSPIEVLGAFEDDPERRLAYARRFNEELQRHIGRTLRWTIATTLAGTDRQTASVEFLRAWPTIERYLQNEGVDTTLFERFRDHDQAMAVAERASTISRAVLFTGYECGRDCRALYRRLQAKLALGQIGGIDVVFVDTTEASIDIEKVERWALDNGVTQRELDRRAVALNHDSAPLAALRERRAVPLAVDAEGGAIR